MKTWSEYLADETEKKEARVSRERERQLKERKKQTNADRIRAMSDEELAELLVEHHRHPCKFCISCWADRESDEGGCREELMRWLKSEVKE